MKMEYLAARLFGRQEIQGISRDYSDLMEAYQISILANEQYFNDEHIVHTFQYYDPEHKVTLGGKSRIITLELEKAKDIIGKPVGEMAAKEAWATYLEYLTDRSKRGIINDIIQREEGIAMTSSVLIEITPEEREAAWRKSRLKYELDRNADMHIARKEGEAEGIQIGIQQGLLQGHTEGLVETARNALAKGLSIELVHEITGLDLEMLKTL